jgi:hypothetical protein
MRITNSSIGKIQESLMSKMERMKKAKQLVFSKTMEPEDNNGMLFILTKPRDHKLRESTRTSVSM